MAKKKTGLIIDLDGTLYRGEQQIEGALNFVERMSAHPDMLLLLMTNNSSRTPEAGLAHLQTLGFVVQPHQFYSSAQATARYVRTSLQAKRVYAIGESGLLTALREEGLEVCKGAAADCEQVDAVVQGIDRDFHYAKLQQAVNFIRKGAVSVSTNPDLLLPSDDAFLPGSGSIAAAIAAASGQEPIIIGKPSGIMMGYALERLGLLPEQVWMIGDSFRTDIAAGQAAGCKTALVLTGVTTRDNLAQEQSKYDLTPDIIVDNLTALAAHLLACTQ